MEAIILAAGRGKRLRPFTDDIPKALLPLQNNSRLIDFTFKALKKNNIRDIVIVVGYKYEAIVRYVTTNYPFPDFSVSYILNNVYDQTNTAFSLLLACSVLTRRGLVINGDTLFSSSSLKKLLNFEDTCIGVSCENVNREAVKVAYNRSKRISVIGKNISGKAEYVGIAKVEPAFGHLLFEQLNYCFKRQKDLFSSWYYDDVINQLVHSHPVYAVDLTGNIAMDIDTFEDLNEAKLLLQNCKEEF